MALRWRPGGIPEALSSLGLRRRVPRGTLTRVEVPVVVVPRLQQRLAAAPPAVFAAVAIAASFGVYFSMYGFRKPFAAAAFAGAVAVPGVGEVGLKSVLIIAQVLGYCLSKFAGIKVISEMTATRRAWAILGFIGWAWAALLLFAVVPAPWSAVCLFLNGVPLGMIWGLVFGFLEGRRLSEVLGAGLSASYILASGVVKSIGRALLDAGVPEVWMPVATGALFVPPLLLGVFALANLPPPDAADIAARAPRAPMDARARAAALRAYGPGLAALVLLYVVLTAYRDFRDNFAVELWGALGYADAPSVLATSEIPVTLGTLGVLGALMLVRDNRRALLLVHGIMGAGTALVGLATLAFGAGWIGPATWMVLLGLGLYVAYVPFGCVLFDRLIAALGTTATAGFFIYITDAFGYLGSVGLLLYRDLGRPDLSWLAFFRGFGLVTSVVCTALFVVSGLYFARLTRSAESGGGLGLKGGPAKP
jgi:hypothetical protein